MYRVLVDCELTKSDALYIYNIFRVFYPLYLQNNNQLLPGMPCATGMFFSKSQDPSFNNILGDPEGGGGAILFSRNLGVNPPPKKHDRNMGGNPEIRKTMGKKQQ